MAATDYRWNQVQAAAAYDAAAPVIHPQYEAVQDAILVAIPYETGQACRVVDLGGGSGRMVERLLQRFTAAVAVLVDQSEPFLTLAKQRLAPYAGRATFLTCRLQDDWSVGASPAEVIVSTSAIHHLVAAEKLALFRECLSALAPGGVFINGDEHRPENDDEYRDLLSQWGRHMDDALAAGAIPESFAKTIAAWKQRNLVEFGSARVSGDNCPETIESQAALLRQAGFANVEVIWRHDLWAVTAATTP